MFYDCNSLSEIKISKTVTAIGKGAFYRCGNLKSIKIPEGVTSIEEEVFSNCVKLTEVTLPNTVESIEKLAFCGCDELYKIAFPEGLKSIASYAIILCPKLKKIEIPKTVTFIGDKAFGCCYNLVKVTVPKNLLGRWDSLFDIDCPYVIKPTEEEAESPAYHKITTTHVSLEDSSESNASVDDFTLSGFCGEEGNEESVKWEYTKKTVYRGDGRTYGSGPAPEGTLTISYTGTGSGKMGNVPIKEIMHFDKNKFESAESAPGWVPDYKEQAGCPPLNEIT